MREFTKSKTTWVKVGLATLLLLSPSACYVEHLEPGVHYVAPDRGPTHIEKNDVGPALCDARGQRDGDVLGRAGGDPL